MVPGRSEALWRLSLGIWIAGYNSQDGKRGAHLNNYETDLSKDNTGKNQKDLYRNGRDSS